MLKKESIDRLTAQLALKATGHEQDWEIELADAARINDFLAAYHDQLLCIEDRRALMALVLASADEYVSKEGQVPEEWTRIAQLLSQEEGLHREAIAYWKREGENDPEGWFSLTPHMRKLSAAR